MSRTYISVEVSKQFKIALKLLARKENRTISAQVRHMLESQLVVRGKP